MSCTLFFTAGAKGGSGKTTAAKFLVTYLREHSELPLLMDLDDENHTLARFFPEALQINLHGEFAQDVLIEKALSKCGGVKTKASDYLGINRNTLNKKVKELGIETAD